MFYIRIIIVVLNLICFGMYGIDKYKAIRHKWRIPERVLLLSAFLMGGYGAMFGMLVFHHKTKHKQFQILIPLAVVLWTVIVVSLGIV